MGLFDFFKEKKKNSESNILISVEQDVAKSHIKDDQRSTFYNLEDIKTRSMGPELMLTPYDGFFLMKFGDADAQSLTMLAKSEKIQRFLPGLGFTDKETTKKRLMSYILKTESQLGVTYIIRGSNFPIGMIFVNSPMYNKKTMNLAVWTIDFFIADFFEHKGIMYRSIIRVLNEMKNAMGAKEVYAIVDRNNADCINVIGNGLFHQEDNNGFHDGRGGEDPLVYMIDLSHINFK